MKPKVSVIIPVYNAAKYLEETLIALSAQTLIEIEFLFVDDCSTDNSLSILQKYEQKDPSRIIIIALDQNQGPGGARNVGLQYASGEYIAFADSDDYMKPEMYECLHQKAIENDYDLVECGYFSERKDKDMMLWDKSMEGEVSFDTQVKMFMSCGFLWSKLYKRNILTNPPIEFIDKIQFEDVDFLNRLYCRIQKVGIVYKPLYYYRNNQESFTRKGNPLQYFDSCRIFSEKYLEHMKTEQIYNIMKPVIEYVVIGIWYDMFKTYVTESSKIDTKYLQIIDNEIKKYVWDYGKNVFFDEQAKHDSLIKAFIVNSYDSKKAITILEEIRE